MKIYTTFNMTVTRDLDEYLKNEPLQALNRKTHIVNHFLNIIETQSNKAITARMPALPQHLATYAGNTLLLNHDYGADLNLLIEKQELSVVDDPAIQQGIRDMRGDYLSIFGKYLAFFKNYTNSINDQNSTYGSEFVSHAIAIQKIDASTQQMPKISSFDKTGAAERVDALRKIKGINPPLFFYNEETIRSIKVIHKTAQTFGPNIEKIGWPKKLIENAKNPKPITDANGKVISQSPPAYFVNAKGVKTTSQADAARLYVNIPTLQDIYRQEIIKQPEWLNSSRE